MELLPKPSRKYSDGRLGSSKATPGLSLVGFPGPGKGGGGWRMSLRNKHHLHHDSLRQRLLPTGPPPPALLPPSPRNGLWPCLADLLEREKPPWMEARSPALANSSPRLLPDASPSRRLLLGSPAPLPPPALPLPLFPSRRRPGGVGGGAERGAPPQRPPLPRPPRPGHRSAVPVSPLNSLEKDADPLQGLSCPFAKTRSGWPSSAI